jgi:hypothetical protein
MVAIGAIIKVIVTSIDSGTFPSTWSEWKSILFVGGSAALAYLIKNFLTNSQDQFLKNDNTPA